ncbi:MAG: hypothetical protein JSS07_10970 [Proteobacteria bacterium]|nr:hypothetical protein [Pseudomonadota bacterium]
MKRGIHEVYLSSEAENEFQPVNSSARVENELQIVNELPIDVLQHIFSFLPIEQLNVITQLSKLWQRLVYSRSQTLTKKYFPHLARVYPQKFNDSPVVLLSKACQRYKEKYENKDTPFSIVLEALGGCTDNIETNKNKDILWAFFLVNGHPFHEESKTYSRLTISTALSIAVENGCLLTLQRLKEIYDKGNYKLQNFERCNLLSIAAFNGRTSLVKRMCSWSDGDHTLSFQDIDKTMVFLTALLKKNFKLATYLASQFQLDFEKLTLHIKKYNIDLANTSYKVFFQSLQKNIKVSLLRRAFEQNVDWIQPYVFDEQLLEMQLVALESAIRNNDIELVEECLSKYQISEFIIFSFIFQDKLPENMINLFLSKLSSQYKNALFVSVLPNVSKMMINCPEISEQCKREAFAMALVKNLPEFVGLMKNNIQVWNKDLQLLSLVWSATLEEIQTFMYNNKFSEDVLQTARFVASVRNDQEITQHLVGALKNKEDELQNIEDIDNKIFVRSVKTGIFSREIASNLLTYLPPRKKIIAYLKDFAPEMLMSVAKYGSDDILKHFINDPMVTAEHKTKAFFTAIEQCYDFDNYLNIIKALLASNEIALNDVEAALQKAQRYYLDELAIVLKDHLDKHLKADVITITFTPAMNTVRNNRSQVQEEDAMMIVDEIVKDKPSAL